MSADPTNTPEVYIQACLGAQYRPDRCDYSIVLPTMVPKKIQQGFKVAGEFSGDLNEKMVVMEKRKDK